MANKKYVIKLTEKERKELKSIIRSGKHSAKKILKAHVLLKSEQGWTDQQIAQSMGITTRALEKMRKQFVEDGFEQFLKGRYSNRRYTRKLNGKQEAQLITIACSEPADGQERWTLRLLANEMVRLEYVDSISHETVRRTLKKTS